MVELTHTLAAQSPQNPKLSTSFCAAIRFAGSGQLPGMFLSDAAKGKYDWSHL